MSIIEAGKKFLKSIKIKRKTNTDNYIIKYKSGRNGQAVIWPNRTRYIKDAREIQKELTNMGYISWFERII